MTTEILKIENGIRLIPVVNHHRSFVTFKLLVKAGSRHDNHLPGLAHMTEHMLFKNAKAKGTDDIYCQIEGLGGIINGSTNKEYTDYSLTILKENVFEGLAILLDILTPPSFKDECIEQEKEVIFEEILSSYSRSIMLWDIFAQTLWEDSPLRHPVYGYKESVQCITIKEVMDFYKRYYTGDNIILVVIGDIYPVKILETVSNTLGGFAGKKSPVLSVSGTAHPLNEKKRIHIEKKSMQTHLLVGYPGVSINSPTINIFRLLNKIVGNGMSSRLYKKLKVDSHQVYSISSSLALYEDAGYFAISTSFSKEKAGMIFEAISNEFNRLKNEEIPPEELNLAKIKYKRDLLLQYENDNSLANFLGSSLLLTGQINTFDEILEDIASINSGQLIETANRFFNSENYYIASIGTSNDKI